MIYTVQISEKAECDLRDIYKYIAFDLLSPENAKKQLSRLEKSTMGLNEMPKRFRLYEKEPWHSRGLRILPVDNFVIFYIPDEERQIVTIIRVMYAGQDIDKELENMYQ